VTYSAPSSRSVSRLEVVWRGDYGGGKNSLRVKMPPANRADLPQKRAGLPTATPWHEKEYILIGHEAKRRQAAMLIFALQFRLVFPQVFSPESDLQTGAG